MDKGIEVYAVKSFTRRKKIDLYVSDIKDRIVCAAKPLEFTETELGSYEDVPPVMSIDMDKGQKLMDDLWTAGIRPSEGTGTAGAMAAVQEHLKDMKKIAFKGLKIEN